MSEPVNTGSVQARSPMALAMLRFWGKPAAKAGCGIVLVFVLLAIYAPLISSEVALLWIDDEGWHFPLWSDLFNRNSYRKPHDLFFNILMLALPAIAAGWWMLRRYLRWSSSRLLWTSALFVVALLGLCVMPMIPSQGDQWRSLWDDRPTTAKNIEHYRQLSESGEQLTAIFPFTPHRFDRPYYSLKHPFEVNPDTDHVFWLGTDDKGFDVFARMIYGARISLTIGLVATGLAMFIGVVIGAISAYMGGMVDLILQRLVEIMMTFPVFILLLVVVAMLGRDIYIIMVVLGLTGWAGTARLVRGEFLAQKGREYVLSCQALGLPRWRIMFVHILPNALTPLLISASFSIAGSILTESGLAFIGLGDDTAPSWGALLDIGRRNLSYVWLLWVPGLAVFALVSSLNLIGNAMREALDPKGA